MFDASSKVNPLAHANKVYVGYCTSDAYLGNRGASDETFGWEFRGQEVLKAVLQVSRGVGWLVGSRVEEKRWVVRCNEEAEGVTGR